MNSIMILCKVVDNYGDIGVAYRLAKALSSINPSMRITLVCSNLKSFSLMASGIDPSKKTQSYIYKGTEWTIIDWNESEDFKYKALPFPVILECFQCGRPDWLEQMLFAPNPGQIFHILNVEYLTAEPYADDFHLLKSYTRSANVKKVFFMPGFTTKTGGLILNRPEKPSSRISAICSEKADFNILFFAYKRDCAPIIKAIARFQKEKRRANGSFETCVFIAAGQSAEPFMDAYKKAGRPFKIAELPFLQQEEWDFLLTQMDFNFVRGEDSLSRAALSGIPHIWNAYIQDDDYQLVKVDALLERMKPFFTEDDYKLIKAAWEQYNSRALPLHDGNCHPGLVSVVPTQEELLTSLLLHADKMLTAFQRYARTLEENGDLALHILEWIEKNT